MIGYGNSMFLGSTLLSGGGGSSFANTKSTTFDGVDEYVNFGNVVARKVQTQTISIWVKPLVATAESVLINGSTGVGNQGLEIYYLFNSFGVRINGGSVALGGNPVNQWTHIAISYNGTTLKAMVNGVLLPNSTFTNINYTFYTGLVAALGPYGFANVKIDEIAFWTSDQSANFSTMYNLGKPGDLTSLSPFNWYRMGDGDSAPTIIDYGTNGNNGTMFNMSNNNFTTDVP
jgi:hypothetical protein